MFNNGGCVATDNRVCVVVRLNNLRIACGDYGRYSPHNISDSITHQLIGGIDLQQFHFKHQGRIGSDIATGTPFTIGQLGRDDQLPL